MKTKVLSRYDKLALAVEKFLKGFLKNGIDNVIVVHNWRKNEYQINVFYSKGTDRIDQLRTHLIVCKTVHNVFNIPNVKVKDIAINKKASLRFDV
jgi:alpha-N-acetylglucosamine transferase